MPMTTIIIILILPMYTSKAPDVDEGEVYDDDADENDHDNDKLG